MNDGGGGMLGVGGAWYGFCRVVWGVGGGRVCCEMI